MRPRLCGVTLEQCRAAQLLFQFPEIEFVFPPTRIDVREFERGSRSGGDQINRCLANVPVSCITCHVSAGSNWVRGTRGLRPNFRKALPLTSGAILGVMLA